MKKIMWRKMNSINSKAMILIIGLGILILTTMGSGLYLYLRQDVEDRIEIEIKETLQYLDYDLNNFFANVEYDINRLVGNDRVRTREDSDFTNFLTADEEIFKYSYTQVELEIIDILNNYRESHPGVNSVYMGRENGSFVRSHPRTAPTQYDPRQRPWYILARDNLGEVMHTEPYQSVTNPDINIGVVSALVDEDNNIFGVIGADITLRNLTDHISNFNVGFGGRVVLFDEKGIILASQDETQLFKDASILLGNKSSELLGQEQGHIDYKTSHMFFYTSPKLGWKIAAIIPETSIFREIWISTLVPVFGLFLGLVLLTVSLFFGLNKLVLKPITDLNQSTQQIAKTGVLRKMTSMKRNDEIGALSLSFNNMVDTLKKKDKELNKSELEYRNLVNNIPIGIYRSTLDGKIIFANQGMANLLGFASPEQLISKNWGSFYKNIKDRERFIDFMKKHKKTDDYQMEFVTQKGKEIHLLFSSKIYKKEISGTAMDITERKLAQAELEAHRDHLAELVGERTVQLKISETRAQFLKEIAIAAATAKNFGDALEEIVKKIAKYAGWPVGHVYQPADDGSGELASTDTWYLKNPRKHKFFKDITHKYRFSAGIGLPGRVLSSKKAVWIEDIYKDDKFLRSKESKDIGMRGAFGFPVVINDEVVAVMEFFSNKPEKYDVSFLDLMNQISIQLESVFERHKVGDALAHSEQKYHSVLNDLPEMIMRWKPDGTITFVNDNMRNKYPDLEGRIVGLNHLDRLQPQNRKQLIDKIKKLSVSSPVISGESFFIDNKDKEHWEEWSERGIFDETGKLIEIQSVGRDISDSKKASETQRKLSSAVEHSQSSVIITNSEGFIEYVNPKFEFVSGYTSDEVIGKKPSILKSGLHGEDFYKDLWKTIRSGNVWRGEFTNLKKNGAQNLEYSTITPITDDAGRITHFVSNNEDISEKRKAENALIESERRLNGILNFAPILVYLNDLDGRYIYINEEYEKVEGISREKVLGKTDFELFPGELAERYNTQCKKAIETQKVQYFDNELVSGDETKYFTDIIFPLFDKTGKVYATCGWSWDITERKLAEDAILKSGRELQERTKELEMFNKTMINREMRIIEMKEEVNRLCEKLGHEPEYPPVWSDVDK